MSIRIARPFTFAAVACLTIFLCACGSKPAADNAASGTAAPAAAPAVANASAPAAGAPVSVSTSGTTTTVTGVNDQTSPAIPFGAGVYVFNWTSTGGFMGITLKDANDQGVLVLSLGGPNGQDLCDVGTDQVKPGDLKLEVSSDAAWTLKIEKVDASGPAALPQALLGEEMKIVISKPFALDAGTIGVSYTYKSAPKGTGTMSIYNVSTGQGLNTGMMYAGKTSGKFDVKVPTAGVYIAKTAFPLASGGGEVTISK
jgi:hypothetical protein